MFRAYSFQAILKGGHRLMIRLGEKYRADFLVRNPQDRLSHTVLETALRHAGEADS